MRATVRFRQLLLVGLVGLLITAAGVSGGWGAPSDGRMLSRKLLPLLGPSDALMIVGPDGAPLAEFQADKMLVPASTLKILTSLAALHYLGAEYRFATEFYLSPQGALKVKGYGDPLLVSERLAVICRQIGAHVTQVEGLVLDDSYIAQPVVIPGRSHTIEPYDAPNGALCVNFNTVNFKRLNGRWISAEAQTPLLESTLPKIKASGLMDGRITLAASGGEGARYAGELLLHFLGQAGVAVNGPLVMGTVDLQQDRLLLRYESEDPLTTVIAGLLRHSNNFIANQLVLTMGAQLFGPPATMEKGLQALRAYFAAADLGPATLAEGSGISRQNRISARTLIGLLDLFQPYRHLMRNEGRQWYKTGTLSGISTRAGYLDAPAGGQYRFAVMLNTAGRSAERIMRVVESHLP